MNIPHPTLSYGSTPEMEFVKMQLLMHEGSQVLYESRLDSAMEEIQEMKKNHYGLIRNDEIMQSVLNRLDDQEHRLNHFLDIHWHPFQQFLLDLHGEYCFGCRSMGFHPPADTGVRVGRESDSSYMVPPAANPRPSVPTPLSG